MGYPVFYPIAGDTLIVPFDTFDGGTGASITMTGLAVTDIEIFADGSATTRASDNGYVLLDTDGIDRAGVTGIHGFSIDLSDNSDVGFFTVGPWYEVWVSAVTVDGQTVSFIAAMFRILDVARGMAGTALPPNVADDAGGLIISIAGSNDPDQMAVETARLTAARAGALTDWLDGNRLDLLLDAIKVITDANPDSGAFNDIATILARTPVLIDGKVDTHAVEHRTTIATLTTQTDFTLTAGSVDDAAYEGWRILVQDASTAVQRSAGWIKTYTGATKRVQLQEALAFTIATTDIVRLAPAVGLKPTTAGRTLDVDASGLVKLAATGLDAINQAATGMVEIAKAIWDRVLTGATHNDATSAGRRLRNIQDFGIYDMASTWVDENNGTSTGTIDGEDATVANRATDFDNALTVAVSVGLDAIHVQNGNVITLSGTLEGMNVWSGAVGGADGWTLVLAGQSIANSCISGATISGIATGASPSFRDCKVGTVTIPPMRVLSCSLTSTVTVGSAGNFQFIDCQSGVAGESAPTVDLGAAVGATTMEFRRWSGSLTLANVKAGDAVSVDVVSGREITIGGTGGTVVVNGECTITDNSGGSVSIVQTSTINMTKINDEVLDVMNVDTYAEPGQGAPAATASIFAKINYLYKNWRNRKHQDATGFDLFNDDASTVDQKATVSDDGTDLNKGEMGTGP